jgi:hypothetical protein
MYSSARYEDKWVEGGKYPLILNLMSFKIRTFHHEGSVTQSQQAEDKLDLKTGMAVLQKRNTSC